MPCRLLLAILSILSMDLMYTSEWAAEVLLRKCFSPLGSPSNLALRLLCVFFRLLPAIQAYFLWKQTRAKHSLVFLKCVTENWLDFGQRIQNLLKRRQKCSLLSFGCCGYLLMLPASLRSSATRSIATDIRKTVRSEWTPARERREIDQHRKWGVWLGRRGPK